MGNRKSKKLAQLTKDNWDEQVRLINSNLAAVAKAAKESGKTYGQIVADSRVFTCKNDKNMI